MTDILERLDCDCDCTVCTFKDAKAEIERLRAALREIAERKTYSETAAAISAAAIARAALEEK